MTKGSEFHGGELVDSVSGAPMPHGSNPSTGERTRPRRISNEQDHHKRTRCARVGRRSTMQALNRPVRQIGVLDFPDEVEKKHEEKTVKARAATTASPHTSPWQKRSLRMVEQIRFFAALRPRCWRQSAGEYMENKRRGPP